MKLKIERDCLECGVKMIITVKNDVKRKKFCSMSCRSTYYGKRRDMSAMTAKGNTPEANAKKALYGEAHPRWKPAGSRQPLKSGYVRVKLDSGYYEYEHRVIAGAAPGDGKHVHHNNRTKNDNNPSNLQHVSPARHSQLHKEKL